MGEGAIGVRAGLAATAIWEDSLFSLVEVHVGFEAGERPSYLVSGLCVRLVINLGFVWFQSVSAAVFQPDPHVSLFQSRLSLSV